MRQFESCTGLVNSTNPAETEKTFQALKNPLVTDVRVGTQLLKRRIRGCLTQLLELAASRCICPAKTSDSLRRVCFDFAVGAICGLHENATVSGIFGARAAGEIPVRVAHALLALRVIDNADDIFGRSIGRGLSATAIGEPLKARSPGSTNGRSQYHGNDHQFFHVARCNTLDIAMHHNNAA
jgi:hypothetical protein